MPTEADMLISTRRLETWPRADYLKIDRASNIFKSRNVRFSLTCANPLCPDPAMKQVQVHDDTFVVRCGCTDRVISRYI